MKIRRPTLKTCFADAYEETENQRKSLLRVIRGYSLSDEEHFFLISHIQDLEYAAEMLKMFATDHGKKFKE